MKKLVKYLKNYRKESITAPLFKMLEASFELMIPIVMAKIIDIGIRERNIPYIWKMCAVMVGLGVLGLVCSLTAQYFAAKAAWGFGTELRMDVYRHINRLSYSELDKIGTPTLVNRMTNDIMQVQTGVNMALRLFLRSPFIVAGAVIMAFTISHKLTLIFIGAVILIGLVLYMVTHLTIPMYTKVQKILDQLVLKARENYIGARVVRAFGREQKELDEFTDVNRKMKENQTMAGKIAALMNPMTFVLVNAAVMLILWNGGQLVDTGIITQGEIVALVNYMSQILLALTALANLMIIFTKAVACAGRVNSVLELQPSMREGHDTEGSGGDGRIVFDHVTFSYEGAKEPSLEDITFTVEKGESIGIIGATGSGKSTLLQLIPRMYDCQKGQVLVNGKNVKEYDTEQLRKTIGIVPQKAVLVKGSIRDNLLWGDKNASDEKLWECLSTAQADKIVKERAGQLDAGVEAAGRNLSGGQRQRLTIARAFVRDPEILILDDSTSALDYATDSAFRKALYEKKGTMTIFTASQRASAVRHSDKILVLDDGKLAGVGTHDELIKECDIYKEICRSQYSGEEAAEA